MVRFISSKEPVDIQGAPESQDQYNYLERNVRKLPVFAIQSLLSGLGAGSTAEVASRSAEKLAEKHGAPQIFAQIGKGILPTTEQVKEKVTRPLFGKELTESRLIDRPAEYIGSGLPALLFGGVPTLGALGRHALTSISGGAGAEIGSKAAQIAGGGEVSQLLSGLAGGYLGSVGAHALVKPPSTRLAPLAAKKMEALSKEAIQDIERSKPLRIETLDKSYGDAIQKIKERTATQIKQVDDAIAARAQQFKGLEESRKAGYSKAQPIAQKITEPAPRVQEAINEIVKRTPGMAKGERSVLYEDLNSLSNLLKSNKGKLNVQEAINFKQDLNAARYNKNLPATLRRNYERTVAALNEFIAEQGKKYPEHAESFGAAEKGTIELKKLQQEDKALGNNFNRQKERISNQAQTQINKLENQLLKSKIDIENETPKQFQKKAAGANVIDGLLEASKKLIKGPFIGPISSLVQFAITGKGLDSALTGLGLSGIREYMLVKDIFKAHPEIWKDIQHLTTKAVMDNPQLFTTNLQNITNKIESYIKPTGEVRPKVKEKKIGAIRFH